MDETKQIVAKRQKVEEETDVQSVIFSIDLLSKVIPYLHVADILSIALSCKRLGCTDESTKQAAVSDGISGDNDDDDDSSYDNLSLLAASLRRIIQQTTTEEERAAIPRYDGGNWLESYYHLQLLRVPLAFDQIVGENRFEDKSRISASLPTCNLETWATAYSNKIMRAGRHYVTFKGGRRIPLVGIMRPGQVMSTQACGHPLDSTFYQHFSKHFSSLECNDDRIQYESINCCLYYGNNGMRYARGGRGEQSVDINSSGTNWDGMETATFPLDEIGMLLDLDRATLSVYKNGRKLGVMLIGGLYGPYCWVAALKGGDEVTMKQGVLPETDSDDDKSYASWQNYPVELWEPMSSKTEHYSDDEHYETKRCDV